MPNWTTNCARYEGKKEDIKQLRELMGEKFDFDKILPMPEELNLESGARTTTAILYYLKEKHGDSLAKASEDLEKYLNFHHLLSEDKLAEHLTAYLECLKEDLEKMTEEEKEALYQKGKSYVSNIDTYGGPTWYEWRCKHWGTKWPASGVELIEDTETCIEWKFYTAWAMPAPIYETIEARFPLLSSKISWVQEEESHIRRTVEYTPPYWLEDEEAEA